MTRRQQRLVLGMILLITVVEYGHRQLLALALVPIGVDLGVSDTALGALLTAFGVTYAAAALLLGRLADRTSRCAVLAAGAAFFSVMTALGAVAGSYLGLVSTRLGVGVGQAGVSPASTAILSDTFPPERRATMLGLVAMAAPFGIAVALVAGGFGIEAYGWRPTFVAAGVIGVLVSALFALLVKEPPRGFSEGREAEADRPPSFVAVVRHLGRFRSFRHVLVATALSSLAAITAAQWAPGFLHRVHGMSIRDAGLAFAVCSLASALGSLLSGVVSDRAGSRDARWYGWVPAIGSLLAAPLHLIAFLWPGAFGAVGWLVPALFFAMFFGPPATASVQSLAPIAMRASAGAVLASTLIFVGMGAGPLLAGAVSDLLHASHGEESLRYALCGVSGVYAWSSAHFFSAARTFRQDLVAAARG
ncbi:MAG: MFS transporter [Deltaproteobacteria bacterium]|nr:MFS transporter [Deltaproteobacteria bacterium]MBW2362103.1 MFS transporter [Deltaproteobacteria bacterium]